MPRDLHPIRGIRYLYHRAVMLAALCLAVAACETGPTKYTKGGEFLGSQYGYSDKAMGADEYSIVVTGNPRTGRQQVADIALLRAAHLSREHGRTHFVIMNQG